MTALTIDELLLGGRETFTIDVPAEVLVPGLDGRQPDVEPGAVTLRPLVLADVQRIQKAARDDEGLTTVLMVQQSMVSPSVTIDQVNQMHCGLVEFLFGEVTRISGLSMGRADIEDAIREPMARACFELARRFGWTPEDCAALTVGQVLMYLEMAGANDARAVSLP